MSIDSLKSSAAQELCLEDLRISPREWQRELTTAENSEGMKI